MGLTWVIVAVLVIVLVLILVNVRVVPQSRAFVIERLAFMPKLYRNTSSA